MSSFVLEVPLRNLRPGVIYPYHVTGSCKGPILVLPMSLFLYFHPQKYPILIYVHARLCIRILHQISIHFILNRINSTQITRNFELIHVPRQYPWTFSVQIMSQKSLVRNEGNEQNEQTISSLFSKIVSNEKIKSDT